MALTLAQATQIVNGILDTVEKLGRFEGRRAHRVLILSSILVKPTNEVIDPVERMAQWVQRQLNGTSPNGDPMKPSIGRIVIYNHPGSADHRFPPMQSPALIQKVNDDGSVEMVVFSVYGGLFFNHRVEQGDGPSQWNWPVRVPD